MIVTVPAPAAIDKAQLRAELEAAGYVPLSASRDGSNIQIEFDDADRIDPMSVQEVVAAHVPNEIVDLDALVVKARAVWAATDTFTQAQAQKILAGLVLLENKRR